MFRWTGRVQSNGRNLFCADMWCWTLATTSRWSADVMASVKSVRAIFSLARGGSGGLGSEETDGLSRPVAASSPPTSRRAIDRIHRDDRPPAGRVELRRPGLAQGDAEPAPVSSALT